MTPESKYYRVAIIGLGQIGFLMDEDPARDLIWSHAEAYARHSGFQVTAVCDPDQDRLSAFSDNFRQAHTFTDHRELLETVDVDVVSVCTPNAYHLDVVRALARKQSVKAIFCEKPMGLTDADAEDIVGVCERNGVVLAVNYMRRWDPVYQAVQDLIASGSVGELRTVSAYGATALLTSSSHLIDLMLMFGGEPDWVCGASQTDYVRVVHGVEDPGGVGLVRFKGGSFGFLKGVSASPKHYMFELDLLFTEGRIVVAEDGRSLSVYRFEDTDTPTGSSYKSLQPLPGLGPLPTGERMLNALDDIISCLETGGSPQSNGTSAMLVRKLITCLRESDSMGCQPVII